MTKLLLASLLLLWASAASVAQPNPTALCQPGMEQPGTPMGGGCSTTALPLGTVSAAESSRLFKTKPGTVSGFQINNTSASARWVMVFNATAAEANGAKVGCTVAQTAPCVLKWYQVGGSSTVGVSWSPGPPLVFNNGLWMACSSTGPFTLTLAADCVFSGEIN